MEAHLQRYVAWCRLLVTKQCGGVETGPALQKQKGLGAAWGLLSRVAGAVELEQVGPGVQVIDVGAPRTQARRPDACRLGGDVGGCEAGLRHCGGWLHVLLASGKGRQVISDTMGALQTQPETAVRLLCAQTHQEAHRCVAYK